MNHHSTFLENTNACIEMRDYWGLDTNQDHPSDWDKAKLRILIVFLSSYETKAISNTYTCVSTLMKSNRENWTDIFVDATFYPSQSMQDTLTKLNIPLMVGICSHRDWRDYDIVAISHSISLEALNLPRVYAHSNFPFSHEERFKDPNCPLVLYGGAASTTCFPALGGKIEGHGQSFYDIAMLGMGEPILTPLIDFLYTFNLEHPLKENKTLLIENILDQPFSKQLLFPYLYDIHHSKGKITSITKLDPRIPDKVELNRVHYPIFKGFYRKYFAPNGVGSERHDVQISSGCSSYCCSFCAEGQEGGHYTEKPIKEIEEDILKSKCFSAANNFNAFSYNNNYYSQYFDMLKLFITHSSSTSIFNQRADVLGNSPDYVAAAKKMGVSKISTACEGISERVRQNVLNKNLPRKTLVQACKNVFIQKMLNLKFTMILTGLETKEDLEDFYSTIDEILAVRLSCHSNTSISLTFTPLVYYIQTPIRYEPRVVAKSIWEHTKLLAELVPFLKDRGIRMKFNGSGITTYFEQMMIDAGWQMTNVLKDFVLNSNVEYIRGVSDSHKELLLQLFEKYNIPYDFSFNGFDPDKDILPNDMVAFTTEKKLEEWKEMYKKHDYYHPLCLRTAANLNAKCYNCGSCDSVEEKKTVFNRTLNDTADLNTVLQAMTKAKPRTVIKVVVKQFPQFAFYSKEMLSHYITSQFLRRDEVLAKAYYKVSTNSVTWLSDNYQPPIYSGNFVFNIFMKDLVSLERFTSLKEEVNKVLETCSIVSLTESSLQEELSKNDTQLYLCNIPFISSQKLQENLFTFDWNVNVATKAFPSVKFVKTDFLEFKDSVFFKPKGSGVVGALALPLKYSPFSVISAITKKNLDFCHLNSFMQIVDTVRLVDANCSCGKKIFYSYSKSNIIKLCPSCYLKRVLSTI